MKAIYIGILTPGTTSRMRAERLNRLMPKVEWQWIDTDGVMQASAKVWRSLAFRLKSGLAVGRINAAVRAAVVDHTYDLAWVDKGVFLTQSTLRMLRQRAGKLVHYTPDAAFLGNQSRHFERGLGCYDVLATTKSFELDEYRRRGVSDQGLICVSQGYDPAIHWPMEGSGPRRREVVFVGLAEQNREECLGKLLEAGVPVRLGGKGWRRFLERYGRCGCFAYEGDAVFGEAYASLYSSAWVGLGLLSKRFPELHTTRTFEIPACGAILATERNVETERFFDDGEALFFSDYTDLTVKVKALLAGPEEELQRRAVAGWKRVKGGGRDYDSLLRQILARVWPERDGLFVKSV